MIRIFISSVFTAFEDDRNRLNKDVFKEMKVYCESKGFSFQIIDLRWGISPAQADQYRTARLCLQEIKRCQMQSPKPNFLILSDDHYGWVPLPETISEQDFQAILKVCAKEERQELATFYFQDHNDILHGYYRKDSEEKIEPEEKEKKEEAVKLLLFEKAHQVLPKEKWLAFGSSLTAQEIQAGLFDLEDARSHVIACIRENQMENPEIEKRKLANELKQHLESVLSSHPEHLIHYAQGDEDALVEHTRVQLKAIIDERIASFTSKDDKEEEIKDALAMSTQDYLDVDDQLGQLARTIEQAKGKILVVEGEQGAGKTTLLKSMP